ncbi:hypothetical protein [Acidovorax sp.]|uniref:hypothetical protein n=1 Tax=Acidovorax sp. TaxID=1872122 RepID=UPI00391AF78B
MTEQTQPTDAEIKEMIPDGDEWKYGVGFSEAIMFARAVLAKWGTPPAVAGEPVAWQQGSLTTLNQDPYPALGKWFVQFWEGDDVAARVYGSDAETLRRRCAAITTPQPTQAQAGAVPLTHDEALDAFCHTPGIHQFVQAFVAGVRFAEQHHGIKGGQHGAE